jgi:hypothetical protein
LECMAGTTGLEPATSAVTGQRSNQLSYVPKTVLHLGYMLHGIKYLAAFAISLCSIISLVWTPVSRLLGHQTGHQKIQRNDLNESIRHSARFVLKLPGHQAIFLSRSDPTKSGTVQHK